MALATRVVAEDAAPINTGRVDGDETGQGQTIATIAMATSAFGSGRRGSRARRQEPAPQEAVTVQITADTDPLRARVAVTRGNDAQRVESTEAQDGLITVLERHSRLQAAATRTGLTISDLIDVLDAVVARPTTEESHPSP